MADVKVSGLPSDSSLDGNHYVPINDPTGPTTKRTLLSVLAAFFFNQTNIPDGTGSPRTRMIENEFDYVASGLVWSGDAYASTRNGSMTAGVAYINGRRISVAAVVARSFTASKDTYVDLLDNGDGTGTLVYTEVTNNAASPTLAANSLRIGIIVTGAANIAAVGSINQGQTDKVLPVAGGVFYQVTDTLGNLICPRDPNRRVLGYRQISSAYSGNPFNVRTDVPGLTLNVNVLAAYAKRRVRVTSYGSAQLSSGAGAPAQYLYTMQDGGTLSRNVVTASQNFWHTAFNQHPPYEMPAAGLHSFNAAVEHNNSSTMNLDVPAYVLVEML